MAEASSSRVSVTAVLALLLGAGLVTGPFALFAGVQALREVNRADGRLRGRRLAVAGLALGALGTALWLLGGFALVLLSLQDAGHRAACTNNLRLVGQAVNRYHDTHNDVFPPGTVANDALPPARRLSWQAAVLPVLPEGGPAGKRWQQLAGDLDFRDAWDAPANDAATRQNVSAYLCPAFARGFAPGRTGLTSYVGIAGVGLDAPTLSRKDPRAGFFGYDRLLSRPDITAGISTTMLAAETGSDAGPWAAGGPPTVRGLDPACQQYVGLGRPFGGLHREGANVLWADGSVRLVGDRVPPALFRNSARISRDDAE